MSNVTFTNNFTNRVSIDAQYSLGDNVTLTPQPGMDGYEVKGTLLDIGSSVTLTMTAGSKLLFPMFGSLNVLGHLKADGTVTQPVTLTSIADSGPGEWGGIYFSSSGSGNLNYATVRNAYTGTTISGGQVNATCTTFTNNQGGVQVESFGTPTVVITNSTISGNGGIGVVNDNSTQVDARYNWWGDAGGPSGSGPGSGDAISGDVLYSPWLSAPPSCDGGGSGSPSLQIAKSGSTTAQLGDSITYTLTITNSGTATATNLVITDAIPAGASYISGGTQVGSVVSWTVASLPVSNTTQASFVVTVTQTITNSDYIGGAGLWIGGAEAVTVSNSTIVSNAQLNGGSGSGGVYGSVTLNNTILAGNSGGMYADCQGTINSLGYNLIENVPSAQQVVLSMATLPATSPALTPTWVHCKITVATRPPTPPCQTARLWARATMSPAPLQTSAGYLDPRGRTAI